MSTEAAAALLPLALHVTLANLVPQGRVVLLQQRKHIGGPLAHRAPILRARIPEHHLESLFEALTAVGSVAIAKLHQDLLRSEIEVRDPEGTLGVVEDLLQGLVDLGAIHPATACAFALALASGVALPVAVIAVVVAMVVAKGAAEAFRAAQVRRPVVVAVPMVLPTFSAALVRLVASMGKAHDQAPAVHRAPRHAQGLLRLVDCGESDEANTLRSTLRCPQHLDALHVSGLFEERSDLVLGHIAHIGDEHLLGVRLPGARRALVPLLALELAATLAAAAAESTPEQVHVVVEASATTTAEGAKQVVVASEEVEFAESFASPAARASSLGTAAVVIAAADEAPEAANAVVELIASCSYAGSPPVPSTGEEQVVVIVTFVAPQLALGLGEGLPACAARWSRGIFPQRVVVVHAFLGNGTGRAPSRAVCAEGVAAPEGRIVRVGGLAVAAVTVTSDGVVAEQGVVVILVVRPRSIGREALAAVRPVPPVVAGVAGVRLAARRVRILGCLRRVLRGVRLVPIGRDRQRRSKEHEPQPQEDDDADAYQEPTEP
mmetsp:Transcript_80847/g.233805  ORF Transcript_80847/g.233805 Transcript_80847/m.233805 type:complete len:549 (-) Transcript_80847:116-1762(-)